jgi:hypothetical protein
LGAAGTLVAHVLHVTATDADREFGKRHPELRPPEPGERIVLGSGTLFTEKYGDGPVAGVRPDDGRAEYWMDSNAIFRCKDQLVRLEFEMPKDSAPAAGTARRVQVARQEGEQVIAASNAPAPASSSGEAAAAPGPWQAVSQMLMGRRAALEFPSPPGLDPGGRPAASRHTASQPATVKTNHTPRS